MWKKRHKWIGNVAEKDGKYGRKGSGMWQRRMENVIENDGKCGREVWGM